MSRRLPSQCPRCNGKQVVPGNLLAQTGASRGIVFRPRDRKWWSFLLPDAKVSTSGRACMECGLFWMTIHTGRLKKVSAAAQHQGT
jgi:hypothetical protein